MRDVSLLIELVINPQSLERGMADSQNSYNEEAEDAATELNGQLHDNLYYARDAIVEGSSSVIRHVDNIVDFSEDLLKASEDTGLDFWLEYAQFVNDITEDLKAEAQADNHDEVMEILDKIESVDPLAFDKDNPNHRHPDEW